MWQFLHFLLGVVSTLGGLLAHNKFKVFRQRKKMDKFWNEWNKDEFVAWEEAKTKKKRKTKKPRGRK